MATHIPDNIDINENHLQALGDDVLDALLLDHTTRRNIFWATNDYELQYGKGKGYGYYDPIVPQLITGDNNMVVMPRVLKLRQQQHSRTRSMAEVFTPSWICNAQNNLIDEAWFGRPNVFNTEQHYAMGRHTWEPTTDKITFPPGKTWHDYVSANRMEITCGEAPYLVSRYDTTTGEPIALERRIGLLDRKLRIINENATRKEWFRWAKTAYQSTYAYEWQGDSLLLAREALLYTFIDYYQAYFGKRPTHKHLSTIAYFISWNIWQMDGLKGVVPNSCKAEADRQLSIWDTTRETKMCPGCLNDDIQKHNGTYCIIRDWNVRDEKKKIRYIDLISKPS